MTYCPCKIRPFPDDTEVTCSNTPGHIDRHRGWLIGRAGPGSVTEITWFDDDRRNFRGDWRQCVATKGCILPAGHPRGCAR